MLDFHDTEVHNVASRENIDVLRNVLQELRTLAGRDHDFLQHSGSRIGGDGLHGETSSHRRRDRDPRRSVYPDSGCARAGIPAWQSLADENLGKACEAIAQGGAQRTQMVFEGAILADARVIQRLSHLLRTRRPNRTFVAMKLE